MIKDFLIRLCFDAKTRKKTWNKLSTQLNYNVPLNIAFKMLADSYRKRNNKILADMFEEVLFSYEQAESVANSFKKYAPFDELMLIDSAESKGNLGQGFELAKKILEAKQKIRKAIVSAIAYPLFLFILLIVLLIVVSTMVVPNFALIVDPEKWTGTAYILYIISHIVTSPMGILLGIMLFLGIFLMIYSFPHLTGKIRIKLDKLPPYSFYRLQIGIAWLFTLSTLIKTGKQQMAILEDMLHSSRTSAYLAERIQAILDNFIGKKFGEALALTGMDFPDRELVDDLKVYSELPNFEDKLYSISEDWLEEGIEKIQDNAKVFNTICLLLISVCIGGIVIGFQSIQQIILS